MNTQRPQEPAPRPVARNSSRPVRPRLRLSCRSREAQTPNGHAILVPAERGQCRPRKTDGNALHAERQVATRVAPRACLLPQRHNGCTLDRICTRRSETAERRTGSTESEPTTRCERTNAMPWIRDRTTNRYICWIESLRCVQIAYSVAGAETTVRRRTTLVQSRSVTRKTQARKC